VVDTGKLSQLQLEGVLYACTKHQELLPSGHSKHLAVCHMPVALYTMQKEKG
jgi:hypothetical protein